MWTFPTSSGTSVRVLSTYCRTSPPVWPDTSTFPSSEPVKSEGTPTRSGSLPRHDHLTLFSIYTESSTLHMHHATQSRRARTSCNRRTYAPLTWSACAEKATNDPASRSAVCRMGARECRPRTSHGRTTPRGESRALVWRLRATVKANRILSLRRNWPWRPQLKGSEMLSLTARSPLCSLLKGLSPDPRLLAGASELTC